MNEKDFYKRIHPNLFSDSRIIKKGILSEDFFSYYLETITSQSKEKEFEDYCRKILSVIICPNLLQQTGPTGGGDSKVDTETFPVSEAIAESWLSGYANLAHTERWAFAISAKKEWKSKLESDVKKIVGTISNGRSYTKIFFVTNQFVPDKKRAETEDILRAKHTIDIRILDRKWLLESTFTRNNQILAIEAFHMSEDLLDVIEVGSMDLERKHRLQEINDELSTIENLRPARIVKLSQESVEILRELEVDKLTAIELLERNIRFTKKYGYSHDYINALYDYCWTLLWWYEDRDLYYEKYLEIEAIFKETCENYSILKKLSTLWISLYSNHNMNKKVIEAIDVHTDFLKRNFEVFIQDKKNPKRATVARFDYQMIRMQFPELLVDVINEYLVILNEMKYNNDINLSHLKKVLELPTLKQFPRYDELFEKLIFLLGEQSMNISSSELLINRGDDLLNSDIYSSIKYYSRALSKLYQEDSKINLIKTLMKLGFAFEKIGLMWSSRSYYVTAFVISFNLYFDEGTAIPGIFLTMRSLKKLELGLGRVNYSLEMNEMELHGLNLYGYKIDEDEELEKYTYYDSLLANHFLSLPIEVVEKLNTLPDYLNSIKLSMSAAAMKYKLGYYDEDFLKSLVTHENVDILMQDLFNLSSLKDFKIVSPLDIISDLVTLETKILGCNVSVKGRRGRIQQEFAATLLAMLENVFATSIVDTIIPLLGSFFIEILEDIGDFFSIDIRQVENSVIVRVTNIDELIEFVNRGLILEKIHSIVIMFITQMLSLERDFLSFRSRIEEENAMFRCFNHSSTLHTFLTSEHNSTFINENRTRYVNKRTSDVFKSGMKVGKESNSKKSKEESVVEFDISKVTHGNIEVSNVIYMPLWSEALWIGLLAIPSETISSFPVIGLIFKKEQGLNIFSKWKVENTVNRITIGIIKGINKKHPYWYRVIIGENFKDQRLPDSIKNTVLFGLASRLHTMEAKSEYTINLLKQMVEKDKKYYFIPVLEKELNSQNLRMESGFLKELDSIIIKDVSEIDEKDFFLHQGILPTDDPVNLTHEDRFIDIYIREMQLPVN